MKKFFCFILTFVFVFLYSCSNNQNKSIIMISPISLSEVSLCNEEISKFLIDYYPFDNHQNYINKTNNEHFFPVAVSFEWENNVTSNNYKLYVSQSEDFSDCMFFETNSTSIVIENLQVGKKYYYKVEDLTNNKFSEVYYFTTKSQPRTIEIAGVSNTRDIGGYKAGNTFVKQQMVYRGACLDNINALGKSQFNKLEIKTIIDLREKIYRTKVFNNVNYIELPDDGFGCYTTGDKSIKDEQYKNSAVEAIRVFAEKNNYPIYFHCQIGRDRTGTLAFMLNGLLGVEYEDLCLDYELSIFSKSGCQDYDNKDTQLTNMKGAISGLNNYFISYSRYKGTSEPNLQDGIINYLVDNGLTLQEIQKIKDNLLEK